MLENQIAQLIHIAKEDITYCEYIINYPIYNGKKNFNTTSSINSFYKNIHNLSFNNGLLIVGSLLNKDKRIISLWNYPEFILKNEKELKNLTAEFSEKGLKTIRNQIIAHQDIENENNYSIYNRKKGFINKYLIQALKEILEEIINKFSFFSTSYDKQYFNNIDDAVKEIEQILNQVKPILTDDYVI